MVHYCQSIMNAVNGPLQSIVAVNIHRFLYRAKRTDG